MVVRLICAQYDKRMPRRFKIGKTRDEMIVLCEKMYCESDITEDLNSHETLKIGHYMNHQNSMMYYLTRY